MRTASQVFYLAVFALLKDSHAESKAPTPSRTTDPDSCAIEPKAIVSDACASYNTLDKLNEALTPSIRTVTQTTDFFAYYRLNLFNNVCPFWSDSESMCGNIACAVNTLENEQDIPKVWRVEELSKLEGPHAGHPGRRQQEERPQNRPLQGELGENVGESCVVEYDDECDERDYCVPEDERASAKGDYVSLVDNPERFTGYAGPGAHKVWDAIYHENCFEKDRASIKGTKTSDALPFGGQASEDFKNMLREHGRQQAMVKGIADKADEGLDVNDQCLEKRVFHRVISGMHASISAHICADYLNKTTGTWEPNLQCYEERLHRYPERISNLYFNFALVLRAVTKLKTHLQEYTFCSGDISQDRITGWKVRTLMERASSASSIFDESLMFQDASSPGLKEDFRNRFRNVSRLMDCVGCDKCRLWGKLQTAGYGTALKVLFEFDENASMEENPPLRRTELVALVNTLDRISSSLSAIVNFREMIKIRDQGQMVSEEGPAQVADRTAAKQSAAEPVKAQQKAIVDEDLHKPHMVVLNTGREDIEDYEDDDESEKKPELTLLEELKESFREELTKVWKTYVYVLKGWYSFPKTFIEILILEVQRLWNLWIGLPVAPRTWEFKRPNQEDIFR